MIKMNIIRENYSKNTIQRSDINEHLPTLYKYAKECSTISEMGVRGIVSTWALLAGLMDAPVRTDISKTMVCVDIVDVPNIGYVQDVAKEVGIEVIFIKDNSATVDLPIKRVDLLFIDTWHVYGHLKRELEKHHSTVNKYIIMHDTEVDKIHGESVRMRYDIESDSIRSGYPVHEIKCGLEKAINEFIDKYKHEWKVLDRFTNNNGLTVLERVQVTKQPHIL